MGRKESFIPEHHGDQMTSWWQLASVDAFKDTISNMTRADMQALYAEIKGVSTVIQAQLEARGKSDYRWWQKAMAAKGFIAAKKTILNVAVQERERLRIVDRKEILIELRESAETGDLRQVVIDLLDVMIHREMGR